MGFFPYFLSGFRLFCLLLKKVSGDLLVLFLLVGFWLPIDDQPVLVINVVALPVSQFTTKSLTMKVPNQKEQDKKVARDLL